MSFTIGENYLLKALDAYPFNMEAVCEALNYALSYDDENDMAWTLQGKVMLYHLKDQLGAEEAFQQALTLNMINHDALCELIWLYIDQERFKEAEKLLGIAKATKGVDIAMLFRTEAVILERKQKFTKAIACLDEALTHTYNKKYESFLKAEIKRIKAKRKRLEKKQRKQEEKQPVVEQKKKNFSLLRMFF